MQRTRATFVSLYVGRWKSDRCEHTAVLSSPRRRRISVCLSVSLSLSLVVANNVYPDAVNSGLSRQKLMETGRSDARDYVLFFMTGTHTAHLFTVDIIDE